MKNNPLRNLQDKPSAFILCGTYEPGTGIKTKTSFAALYGIDPQDVKADVAQMIANYDHMGRRNKSVCENPPDAKK